MSIRKILRALFALTFPESEAVKEQRVAYTDEEYEQMRPWLAGRALGCELRVEA